MKIPLVSLVTLAISLYRKGSSWLGALMHHHIRKFCGVKKKRNPAKAKFILYGILFFLMQETRLSGVCEKVMDHCLAPPSSVHGEGCDNMTMILVQFKKPDESPTATSSS
jgi:hypothetical protein